MKNQFTTRIAKTIVFITVFTLFSAANKLNALNRFSVATGNWNATSTWAATSGGASGASVPVAGDVVTIEGGFTITITAAAATTTLTITSGTLNVGAFTLTVSGTATVNSTLTITSATGAKSFGNLVISAGTFNNTAANSPITIAGNFQNDGTFNSGTGRVTFTGATNNTVTGTASTTAFGGGITVNKGVANTNVLDVQCVITMLSAGLTLTNGTFKLSSASTITPFTAGNVPASAGLWNNGGTMNSSGSNHWVVSGLFRSSAGTTNIGTAADNQLDTRTGGAITIDGGTVNVTGRMCQTSGGYQGFTYTQSGGTINVCTIGATGTGNYAPFSVGNQAGPSVASTFNMSGGIITIAHNAPGAFSLVYAGYYVVATNHTVTGGTVQIGTASTNAAEIIELFASVPIWNLAIYAGNLVARIHNPSTVAVLNDVTIGEGATINSNTMDMMVGRDWSNNGTFTQSTGRVTFNGTAAQTLGGTTATTFNNLTINNTFTTSPHITLGINTTATNNLTMSLGNINLAGFKITLGTAAANSGTLSHGGSSVSGWMYGGNFTRWFNTVTIANGAVAGLFPVGNSGSDFRPFYVSAPVTAPTTGGTITLSHTNSTGVSTVSFMDDLRVDRRHDAFWTSATGDGLAGGTYNLRVEGTGFGIIGAVSDLRLTLIGSVVGTPGINAGTTSNPQVNRTGLTLATLSNNFYIGSTALNNSPLPIELLHFVVNCHNGKANITWATATETNNDYFTVQRSTDAISFEAIGTVKGAAGGNSSTIKNYEFTDESLSTLFYYRLKQTDFNGMFKYFNPVAVDCNNNNFSNIDIYPNPNKGYFIIEGAEPNAQLIIISPYGEKIYSSQINPNKTEIELSKPQKGIYFIKIISEQGVTRASKKLIIQ